jgi:hypothetical protein
MEKNPDFEKLLEKIQGFKKEGKLDLSMEEDLSIAIMNLVSLEEHFFFTASKTGKGEYFDLQQQIREVRKTLLAKMVPVHEGETWCITKHLLAAAMRLIEVGTKLKGDGKEGEAKEVFTQAYKVYSLFWALRLKLVDVSGLKKISDDKLNVHDVKGSEKPWTTEDIVNKLVDCCHE